MSKELRPWSEDVSRAYVALASHPWTEHLPAWSRALDKGPSQFRRIAGSYVREDPSAAMERV